MKSGILAGVLLGCCMSVLPVPVPGPGPVPVRAQVQDPPPPDTVPVDSTRLRITRQLEFLAKPPGIDSTWFVPDSLLSDSALAEREARLTGRRPREATRGSAPGLGRPDSIMAALMELDGYSVTEYASEGADFGAGTKQLVLTGTPESQARLIREGEEITADSALIYSDETGKVWSVGSQAVYQPKDGDAVNSTRIVFDLNSTRGTANQAQTRYNAGAEWILYSDYLTVEKESAYGHDVMFTSCEEEVPHYHFAAKNIKIISNNILVARPVKLYFADVPVAWLPFIAQSTETGRASGILTPTFSINDIVRTSRSYSRRISNLGFYWAISDYMDASVAMDWWSGEHTALTGSYSYNWARQFLRGDVNFRQFWREEGGTERAVDASSNWQMDERTSIRFRTRWASSNEFVRRNSFDPQEVVQSIDSEGGISRRFSFGNLSLSGNRRQYLSDDRVEMTLPTANFSLSPITFLRASPLESRFYNNMTVSGSANFRRSISDRLAQSDSAFSASQADKVKTTAGMSGGLNLGNFSVSSGFNLTDDLVKDVPIGVDTVSWMAEDRVDQSKTEVTWNASLNYQQNLIGSTTITPSLRVSGQMRRSDTDSLANDFVSAPNRISFGASLKTDIYGFFPGFGSFDAIRHKVTTGFDFDYAPEVSPSEIQAAVFNAREVGAQRNLRISLNQTFEAKLGDEAAEERAAALDSMRVDSLTIAADSLRTLRRSLPDEPGNTEALRVDSLILEIDSLLADTTAGRDSQQEARKVTLLALRTSAVAYDFERADREGGWLQGFTTTRLDNNISSDYLRGLNLRISHDLFEEIQTTDGEGETTSSRKLSPHLSSMNLGFSLNSRSWVFQALSGLFQGEEAEPEDGSSVDVGGEAGLEDEAFPESAMDESRIMPGREPSGRGGPRRSGNVGEWRANLSYSLQRPRDKDAPSNQMISSTFSFTPTEKWDVSWRTSYDVTRGSFNDHLIRLTRNLHRWEAYFDFRQTATGNWSFRFEVALTDNEELHFDYQQRSIQEEGGRRVF